MKTFAFIFSLFLMNTISMSAQSEGKSHPITKESFKMKLKVEKNRTFSILSFVSSKGQKISAKLTSPGELTNYNLKPGSIVEGSFRFTTFASEGGLGTTRKFRGSGKGELTSGIIVTEVNPLVTQLAGVGDMAVHLY